MAEEGPPDGASAALPDAVPGSEAARAASRIIELRSVLRTSNERVMDTFRTWDEDESGEIDRREFSRAVRSLLPDVTPADSDLLFETFDIDGSGAVSFRELNRQLRRGADEDLTDHVVFDRLGQAMRVNLASGAVQTGKKSRAKLRGGERARKRNSALPAAAKLKPPATAGGLSVQQQLRAILSANAVRVIDLFRDWDDDQSGNISRKEFRRAIAALGYEAGADDINGTFDDLDADGSGTIEYEELNAQLRRGADMQLSGSLRAGAAGDIVLGARNKASTIDRLRSAKAAAVDPDPLASLRRQAVGPMAASPRSFAKAAALFQRDVVTASRAARPPKTNKWSAPLQRKPPWAARARCEADEESAPVDLAARLEAGHLLTPAELDLLRGRVSARDEAKARLEAGETLTREELAALRGGLPSPRQVHEKLERGHMLSPEEYDVLRMASDADTAAIEEVKARQEAGQLLTADEQDLLRDASATDAVVDPPPPPRTGAAGRPGRVGAGGRGSAGRGGGRSPRRSPRRRDLPALHDPARLYTPWDCEYTPADADGAGAAMRGAGTAASPRRASSAAIGGARAGKQGSGRSRCASATGAHARRGDARGPPERVAIAVTPQAEPLLSDRGALEHRAMLEAREARAMDRVEVGLRGGPGGPEAWEGETDGLDEIPVPRETEAAAEGGLEAEAEPAGDAAVVAAAEEVVEAAGETLAMARQEAEAEAVSASAEALRLDEEEEAAAVRVARTSSSS